MCHADVDSKDCGIVASGLHVQLGFGIMEGGPLLAWASVELACQRGSERFRQKGVGAVAGVLDSSVDFVGTRSASKHLWVCAF